MAKLPSAYAWLPKEGAPKMLMEGVALYGTIELPGTADSPTLLAWADEVGVDRVYTHDSIPWCGLYMAVCSKRAGWDLPVAPLWALSWSKWGDHSPVPMLGDVLTFKRKGGGHVAMYVGEDATHYHILGGNQSDRVCIVRRAKNTLNEARRAHWKIKQPPNVRRVFLKSTGTPVSDSEA